MLNSAGVWWGVIHKAGLPAHAFRLPPLHRPNPQTDSRSPVFDSGRANRVASLIGLESTKSPPTAFYESLAAIPPLIRNNWQQRTPRKMPIPFYWKYSMARKSNILQFPNSHLPTAPDHLPSPCHTVRAYSIPGQLWYLGYNAAHWLVLDCPYCAQPHIHGAAPGPRSSHCAVAPRGMYDLKYAGRLPSWRWDAFKRWVRRK